MGASIYSYLGPYLKVPLKQTTRKGRMTSCSLRTCSNYGRSLRESSNYCVICGSKVETKSFDVPDTQGYVGSIVEQANEDTFFAPGNRISTSDGMEIVLPNGGPWNLADSEDSYVVALTPSLLSENLSRFQSEYAEIIEAIKEEFPGSKLEFGAVAYWN